MIAWTLGLALWLGALPTPIGAGGTGPAVEPASVAAPSASFVAAQLAPPMARRVPVEAGGEAPALLAQPTQPDVWLAEDKLRHLGMAFAATGMAYGLARFGVDAGPAVPLAAGLTLAAGVGKEVFDLRRGSGFSVLDLGWDVVGVGLATLVIREIR